MPYRKSYKKSYSRRPGYRACGKMVVSDAAKALALARGVKRLLNVEIKNFDTQQTTVAVSVTPIILEISNIPQGDTTITRDGAQCKVLSIELSYQINQNASATISSFRIMLVCDKQTNEAVYSSGDLLQDLTQNDAIVSPRNLDNTRRFQVLYDRVHTFSSSGTRIFVTKKRFKLNKILRFDANTSSIADLTENSLSLFMLSSESSNHVAITSFTRLRYVDN